MLQRFCARGWAIVGAVVGIAIFVGLGVMFDWNKSEWASWVQAVGSIAAILAAGAIASWQASASKREFVERRYEADKGKALAIKYILRRVELIVQNAERSLSVDAGARQLAADQAVFIQGALRALPMFEVPSAELVFQLQRVDRDLFYVLAMLNRFAEREALGRKMNSKGLIRRIHRRTAEAVAACDAIIGIRTSDITRRPRTD